MAKVAIVVCATVRMLFSRTSLRQTNVTAMSFVSASAVLTIKALLALVTANVTKFVGLLSLMLNIRVSPSVNNSSALGAMLHVMRMSRRMDFAALLMSGVFSSVNSTAELVLQMSASGMMCCVMNHFIGLHIKTQ
jgi:hypothetical protein